MTRPVSFRQSDLTRAIKAALEAGNNLRSVTISRDGQITVDADEPLVPPEPPSPPAFKGWVYVFQIRGFDLAKIGYSTDPTRRRIELEYGSGLQGGLVELLRFPGDRRLELSLHKRFAEVRLYGEWFRLSGEVEAWIAEMQACEAA